MPKQARNPRLSVVVSEEQRYLLGLLGAAQGRSAASYLSDMLDHFTPALRGLAPRLAAALDAAKGLEGDAARAAAQLASGIAHPFIGDADRQMDLITDILGEEGFPTGSADPDGAGDGPGRTGEAGCATPPLLTGGSETRGQASADVIPFVRREA